MFNLVHFPIAVKQAPMSSHPVIGAAGLYYSFLVRSYGCRLQVASLHAADVKQSIAVFLIFLLLVLEKDFCNT
jgi:hypothetical protein